MIDASDLKVDILMHKMHGQVTFPPSNNFVRIIHTPSGLTVTKHSSRSQIKARDEAMEELEMLLELWEV